MTPAWTIRSPLVEAQTTLASAQSAAINLGIARAQYEHAIAMLVGKQASAFSIPVEPKTSAPPPIPIGLPSQLLERRPDVAAAERNMAAANAQIGVAYAAYYPALTLSANGGVESSAIKNLLDSPSRFWSVGPIGFRDGLRRRAAPGDCEPVHRHLQRRPGRLPPIRADRIPAGGRLRWRRCAFCRSRSCASRRL